MTGLTVGRQKATVMKHIHVQETKPIGRLAFPRRNGPRLKFLGHINAVPIGMPYDIKSPMVAIDVVPLKAEVEPREGRQRRNAATAANMTVRIGELNLLSMM